MITERPLPFDKRDYHKKDEFDALVNDCIDVISYIKSNQYWGHRTRALRYLDKLGKMCLNYVHQCEVEDQMKKKIESK